MSAVELTRVSDESIVYAPACWALDCAPLLRCVCPPYYNRVDETPSGAILRHLHIPSAIPTGAA
jgi:hypothetical protein